MYSLKVSKISLGAGIGLLAGIIIRSATDNVGLWIALSLCFGACNGLVYGNACKAEREGNLKWKSTNKNSGEKCNF